MAFTRQYKEFLKPEVRVSKSLIKPRNIYRISTYSGGDPITKQGEDARYVFVIGKVGDKIHCIKLNEIKPIALLGYTLESDIFSSYESQSFQKELTLFQSCFIAAVACFFFQLQLTNHKDRGGK